MGTGCSNQKIQEAKKESGLSEVEVLELKRKYLSMKKQPIDKER